MLVPGHQNSSHWACDDVGVDDDNVTLVVRNARLAMCFREPDQSRCPAHNPQLGLESGEPIRPIFRRSAEILEILAAGTNRPDSDSVHDAVEHERATTLSPCLLVDSVESETVMYIQDEQQGGRPSVSEAAGTLQHDPAWQGTGRLRMAFRSAGDRRKA
jgi:hypothetical protein